MVYNELEQEGTLSCVRVRLATIAYLDILLCSIWAIYKIRQSPNQISPLQLAKGSRNEVSEECLPPDTFVAENPCEAIVTLFSNLRQRYTIRILKHA